MGIVAKARDDVPMQVGNEIAQAREVDLVRPEPVAQRDLDLENDAHQVRALAKIEIAHLGDMPLPDHTAIAGIFRLVHQNDAAACVAPQQLAAIVGAQLAAAGAG